MYAAIPSRHECQAQGPDRGGVLVTHNIHQKGFDSFTTTAYEEGVGPLRAALEAGGFEVEYQPNHVAASDFPGRADELAAYGAVILSWWAG